MYGDSLVPKLIYRRWTTGADGTGETMNVNAEIIRRGYAAFNSADIGTLNELIAETASWHTPGKSPVAGANMGRDAVLAQFGQYLERTGGTFQAALKVVTADDEGRVVAIHHNSGQRNGKSLDVDCCIVFKVENGRVVEGREHFFNLYAWDEFWA